MNGKLACVGLLVALPAFFVARPATAGLADCGNINVEASADCSGNVSGGCEAICSPLKMEVACAGKLQVECEGECDIDAEASCTASCESSCTAECEVDPVSLDCRAHCEGDLGAECRGQCSASGNRGECEASCKANIQAECEASCTADLKGSVDCEAKCEASCEGSCRAEVRAECQIECQGEAYAQCKSELSGGCEVECERGEAQIFCDSQYVDHGGNLQSCINALRAAGHVEARGSSHAECSGNRCEAEAEGEVSASCAMAPGNVGGAAGPLGLIGLGMLGFGLRRRRRA